MNQPVRVGLVFPRSGQQVFVTVPSHIAESMNISRETRPQLEALAAQAAINSAKHTSNARTA